MPALILPKNYVSLGFISDEPNLFGKADFSDAPEQIHQIHGLCNLHPVQLRVQPARGVPAPTALQDGAPGGDQVRADGCRAGTPSHSLTV